MKRSNDGSPGLGSNGAKRSKASQACASCRRHKTRCELLDGLSQNGSLTCHRCKVLNVPCSFESSSIIHLPPSNSSNQSSQDYSKQTIVVHSLEQIAAASSPSSRPPTCLPAPVNSTSSNPSRCQLPSPTPSSSNSESSVIPIPPAGVNDAKELQPEDLVPDRVPWGPSGKGSFDWTAAPILAIQELANKNNPYPGLPMRVPSGVDRSIHSILTQDQINRLLEIFESRYAPWMCLPPQYSKSPSPLVELIRCTVAARHLDPVTRASVSPRLQKLTEESFLSKLPTLSPSTESIHALLILALWSPLSDAGYSENRDSHTLAAIAVNHAMSLGMGMPELREAASRKPSEASDPNCKTRLWVLLSTMESMTCIGTGRTPISRATDADLTFIDPTVVTSIGSARDVRLGFMSKVLSVVERGCKTRLQNPSNFEHFFTQSHEITKMLGCVYSFILPLPLVSPHERFFFSMCVLQFHGWRLLLSHHFLRELRTVMDGYNSKSWFCTEYKGIPVSISIGQDAIESAMQVLSIALAQQDTGLLAAAPDTVFGLIAFAATWLVVTNFSVYQLKGINLGWASEKLISTTAERLSHIAHSPEHAPARNAHLIMRLIQAWEARHRSMAVPVSGHGGSAKQREESRWPPLPPLWDGKECMAMPRMSAERTTAYGESENEGGFCGQHGSSSAAASTSEQGYMQAAPPNYCGGGETGFGTGAGGGGGGGIGSGGGFGFGAGFNQASDLLMDAEFWTTFMENLETDASRTDSLLSSLTR